jgi:hypothetical protein
MSRASAGLFLVLLAVGACSKHSSDCASSINGAAERMMADAAKSMPPEAAKNMAKAAPKITAALVEVCTQDAWAAEVLACLDAASTNQAMNACNDKLTDPQKEHLNKRQAEVMKEVLPGKF